MRYNSIYLLKIIEHLQYTYFMAWKLYFKTVFKNCME